MPREPTADPGARGVLHREDPCVIKFMLFIDGTWLYSNTPRLVEASASPDFQIDFGRLPRVLAEEVGKRLGDPEYTVVRTHLFGSFAEDVDPRDVEPVQRRLDFFTLLREEYHYEVQKFPINFRGHRLRRADRDPASSFEPREKCVDIALATSMLFNAAMPNAYDVAIVVIGDQDFKPVLQHVRMLGKRIAIASIKGSCALDLQHPSDEAHLRDFDVIWLEELLPRIGRVFEPHDLECQSPTHPGDRRVSTRFYPRKGQKFYCVACRSEYQRQRQAAMAFASDEAEANGANGGPPAAAEASRVGQRLSGVLKHKRADKGYAFIRVDGEPQEFFFHATDLIHDTAFGELVEGETMEFEIKADPTPGRAIPARHVARSLVPVVDRRSPGSAG